MKRYKLNLIHTSKFFWQCKWEIKQDTEFFLDIKNAIKKLKKMKKVLRAVANRVLVIVNLHQTLVGGTIKLLELR